MQAGLVAAAVVAAALAFAAPARADYEAGRKAWDAGDPAAALAEWRAAADAGDRRAMLALGRLRLQGLGAPQDYVEAHKWFNLAASRGAMEAVEERDALAARMTPAQIAAAQERAAAWRPGGAPPEGETAAAAAPAAAPPASDAGPPPPRAIREAEELLAALGYDPGPVDGVWDFAAAVAYRAFLSAAGLPASETLTPETLRALRAAAKGGAAPAGRAAAPTPRTGAPSLPANVAARAARAGNIDGLNAALAAGADPNARDARGRTALMHAADKGYTLLVGPLLAAGADPNLRAPDGATALFMAAAHGHSEIVAALMKAGADLKIEGPKGMTAADAARLAYGDLKAAREKGVDPAVLVLLRAGLVGETFRECDVCPEMVVVPAGNFMMGSPSHEEGRGSDEGPVRRVTITELFSVGVREVTFAEWDACASAGGCGGHRPDDEGWGRGNRPVVNVSWKDAQAYVDWLSRKTGAEYRLLSEAEWEYAARAGTTTRYFWGDDVGRNRANCSGGSCGDSWKFTAPVGSFAANGWGLHDMHGNVWEWVDDCWNGSYAGAPSDGSAWESGNCDRRDLRGGSWSNEPRILRSANRDGGGTGVRLNSVGFRVARTLAP